MVQFGVAEIAQLAKPLPEIQHPFGWLGLGSKLRRGMPERLLDLLQVLTARLAALAVRQAQVYFGSCPLVESPDGLLKKRESCDPIRSTWSRICGASCRKATTLSIVHSCSNDQSATSAAVS